MKTSEIILFIGAFMILIGALLKSPKLFFDIETKDGFMKYVNLCGTALVLMGPLCFFASAGYNMSCDGEEALRVRRTAPEQWTLFFFVTLLLTFLYVVVIGMTRATNRLAKGVAQDISEIAGSFLNLAIIAMKVEAASKHGKNRDNYFYKAGQQFSKGMNDNIPGEEWKKGGDDDENPPRRDRFDRN